MMSLEPSIPLGLDSDPSSRIDPSSVTPDEHSDTSRSGRVDRVSDWKVSQDETTPQPVLRDLRIYVRIKKI